VDDVWTRVRLPPAPPPTHWSRKGKVKPPYRKAKALDPVWCQCVDDGADMVSTGMLKWIGLLVRKDANITLK